MSYHRLNVAGIRSGRLVAIAECGSNSRGSVLWRCQCDCGGVRLATANHIRSGFVSSCGCKRNNRSKSITYSSWRSMRRRCESPRDQAYANYGGRGISVCERWSMFENFLSDMGERPSLLHSIDRIDNDGNYEPGNCRWATAAVQGRNTRFTKLNEESAARIRQLAEGGLSHEKIANQYGVSRSTIGLVVAGRIWK